MGFTTRLNQAVFRALASFTPEERRQLYRCWRDLEADPYVDYVTKFPFPLPPLVFYRQRCGGFVTIYSIREPTQDVVLFNVTRPGQPRIRI